MEPPSPPGGSRAPPLREGSVDQLSGNPEVICRCDVVVSYHITLCMYVCIYYIIYVCMCVCVYVCMYVWMYVSIIYVCVYVCIPPSATAGRVRGSAVGQP
jgi:hypothetical protein